MISASMAAEIRATAGAFWTDHVTDPTFVALAAGKEVGHRIADYVDDQTCVQLALTFTCQKEHSASGSVLARSMGDTWLRAGSISHPVNVKTGLVGSEGRPNIVSLKKVAGALATGRIDSYWLLLVKVDVRTTPASAHVDFVNLFRYLDFVAYDSGTGQLMLKAKEFTAARALGNSGTRRTSAEILDWLYETCEDADRRLIDERRRKRAALQAKVATFKLAPSLALSQAGLRLA